MDSLDIESLQSVLTIITASVIQGFSAGIVISGLSIFVLLFFSAMVSGSEVAFFSLSPPQIHELRTKDTKTNKSVLNLIGKPKRLLATILIANNFINVAIVIISTFITNSLFDFTEIAYWLAFLIQVVVVTALILFLGEILPKVYASQRNMEFAGLMAGPMNFLIHFFYPLSSLLVRSTNFIDRRMTHKGYNVSMSELSDAIELTTDESTPEEEKKILQGIVRFGDIEVKEIMKSRVDVTAVDAAISFEELLGVIIDAGYSRIPVYEGSFDTVRGILYIKDLLPHLDEAADFIWQSLTREAFFVPENKRINDLLEEFQQKKIHMAVVVDEYGGTSGIVTLEDIIEEIVGEISDEHDEPLEEHKFIKLDDRNYIFEGKTSLNDFCKITGIDDNLFDPVKGDSDTLAGLLLELLLKLPEKDEKVSYENLIFVVKSVDDRRIKRIQVEIGEPEENAERNSG